MRARADAHPQKIFLHFTKDARAFSYAEFDAEIRRAANLLAELGIGRGDRVAIMLRNSPEFLFFYFGAMALGGVASPISTHLKSEEIRHILNHSGAKVCITSDEFRGRVASVRPLLCGLGQLVTLEGGISASIPFAKWGRSQVFSKIHADDVAMVVYTSGTTGKAKGALISHKNLLTNAREIAIWLDLNDQDRFYCAMPLFHVNGLVVSLMTALWVGGTLILAERFSSHEFWQVVEQYRPTTFGSVATMLSNLIHLADQEGWRPISPLPLRFGLCGSAPVPIEVIRGFEERFGCKIVEGYGLTECTCRATFNPVGEGRRLGSVGCAIGNEIRVVDEEDRERPRGEIGEIVLRGENVMKGYLNDPEATARALKGGWLHTGDLGLLDGDGYLYIVDRKSNLIIRGGENIYPREIDQILYSHGSVRDAATIGIPDEKYGEEVKSFVVLRDGAQISESELISFCRFQLADYKCPKTIQFVMEIPKSPTGKVLKKELRAMEKNLPS
jgi:long-chain acyl-CoA synthetase